MKSEPVFDLDEYEQSIEDEIDTYIPVSDEEMQRMLRIIRQNRIKREKKKIALITKDKQEYEFQLDGLK